MNETEKKAQTFRSRTGTMLCQCYVAGARTSNKARPGQQRTNGQRRRRARSECAARLASQVAFRRLSPKPEMVTRRFSALGINGYRQCYEHTYVLLLSTGSLFSVDSWGFNLYTSPMLGRVIDMTIMSHDVIMLHLVAILQTRPI